jgi:hypothetical protein
VALDVAGETQAMQRSGQVNRLTIKSNTNTEGLMALSIAFRIARRNVSSKPPASRPAASEAFLHRFIAHHIGDDSATFPLLM